jgi:hypothetical protein
MDRPSERAAPVTSTVSRKGRIFALVVVTIGNFVPLGPIAGTKSDKEGVPTPAHKQKSKQMKRQHLPLAALHRCGSKKYVSIL